MRTLAFAAALSVACSAAAQGTPEYGSGLRLNLNDEKTRYIRLITWVQAWSRYMETNPGSVVDGNPTRNMGDVGLRRARLLLFGQVHPRVLILSHVGINNQQFNGARKPGLFFHEALVEFAAVPTQLHVGAGLHYWNGVSRMSSASTLNLMAIDAPIVNWPTLDTADQFGRNLGVYAKGQVSKLDYRVAVNKPLTAAADPANGTTGFNPKAGTFELAGYAAWQFWEKESDVLPYTVGTYLGSLKVLNLGVGASWQRRGMVSLSADGAERTAHDMLLLGVDAFVDTPLGESGRLGAITGYAAFYHYDFGPNYVRQVGVMNPATGGSTLNGAGNAAPVIGTGEHVYVQGGYLLPVRPWGTRLQPYVGVQASKFAAYQDLAMIFDLGLNWYIFGHHGKLTLDWKNRPLFEAVGTATGVVTGRRNELVLQAMAYF